MTAYAPKYLSNAMGIEGGQKVFVILVHRARSPSLSAHRRCGSSPLPRPSAHALAGSASNDTRRPSSRRNSCICAGSCPCFIVPPSRSVFNGPARIQTRSPTRRTPSTNPKPRYTDLNPAGVVSLPGVGYYFSSSARTRKTIASTNRQSMAIVTANRIQDDFSSMPSPPLR